MPRAKKLATLEIGWGPTSATCPVRFVEGIFGENDATTADLLRTVAGTKTPRVFLIADENAVRRQEGLGSRIGRYFQSQGIVLIGTPIVLMGGEKMKSDNFQTAFRVISGLLEAKVGAQDLVMVLGGGALFDVAGYAASQVRGGIRVVRVPTTPTAMVDAAFAPTAAMNFPGIKDALRVPNLPSAVLIDCALAMTVLDGVWRGGLGEMVRQAAVTDAALMKKIAAKASDFAKRDKATFVELVQALVESRAKKGPTDFALWSAGRLESMSNYRLPHGYAVPISICIDCAYALETKVIKESDQETICRALADGGALEGLAHSHHLLSQAPMILCGLDAWILSTGSSSLTIPTGLGKSMQVTEPSREVFTKVIKEFLEVSSSSEI